MTHPYVIACYLIVSFPMRTLADTGIDIVSKCPELMPTNDIEGQEEVDTRDQIAITRDTIADLIRANGYTDSYADLMNLAAKCHEIYR